MNWIYSYSALTTQTRGLSQEVEFILGSRWHEESDVGTHEKVTPNNRAGTFRGISGRRGQGPSRGLAWPIPSPRKFKIPSCLCTMHVYPHPPSPHASPTSYVALLSSFSNINMRLHTGTTTLNRFLDARFKSLLSSVLPHNHPSYIGQILL